MYSDQCYELDIVDFDFFVAQCTALSWLVGYGDKGSVAVATAGLQLLIRWESSNHLSGV